MKQTKVKFPLSKADTFATWIVEHNCKVILSYAINPEWFGDATIVAIVAVPDDKVEAFKTSEWFKHVIQ